MTQPGNTPKARPSHFTTVLAGCSVLLRSPRRSSLRRPRRTLPPKDADPGRFSICVLALYLRSCGLETSSETSSAPDQVLFQFKVHISPSTDKYPGCVLAPPILPGMHRRRLVWTWVSYLSQNAFGEKKKKSVLPFSRPPGVRTSNRTPQVQTSEVHKYGLGVLGIEKRP